MEEAERVADLVQEVRIDTGSVEAIRDPLVLVAQDIPERVSNGVSRDS